MEKHKMALKEDVIVEQLFCHRVRLMAYIRSIVCDFHAAEDVYQNVSVQAIQNSSKFNDLKHLYKWLWVVSHTEAISYLKQNKRPYILDTETLEAVGRAFRETTFRQEEYTILSQCLSRLSDSARELLKLRYEKGFTGNQLAEYLSRTRSSVFVTLSRIHQSLRECVKQYI
jgi:RNA polymerase sigma-70 factor, ECF subfamily